MAAKTQAGMHSWCAAYRSEMGLASFRRMGRGVLIAFMGGQLFVFLIGTRRPVSRRVKGTCKVRQKEEILVVESL
jgi:hypothetical protein